MQDRIIAFCVAVKTWIWAQFQKTETAFQKLDQRADQKLGFVSTPLLGSILGGGIPAFIASRALIYGTIAAAGLWWLNGHDKRVVAERDKVWEEKLKQQVLAAQKLRIRLVAQVNARIGTVDTAWQQTFATMTDRNKTLEGLLKETTQDNDEMSDKLAQTQCVSKGVVNVLRLKVRDINRRSLK